MLLLQHLFSGIVLGCTYTLFSLGLTLIFGILGIVNYAHGEFYMFGAFIAFYIVLLLETNYFMAVVLSTIAMALLGFLIERSVFRPLRGHDDTSVIVATIGLSIFMQNLGITIFGPDPVRLETAAADINVTIGGITVGLQRIIVVLVTVALIVTLHLFSQRTRMGKAMRACSQDLTAAKMMGININRVTIVTTMIGAALAGIGGALVAPLYLVSPVMGIKVCVKAFAVVILGGLGNVPGAIFGGFLVGIAESVTAGMISSHLRDVVAFAILVVALLFKPEGLFAKHVQEKV